MKLPLKLAGLLSSGVFILAALPGFYQHVRPTNLDAMLNDPVQGMAILETLGVSLLGALVAGAIGYIIGDILSKPQGNAQRGRGRHPARRQGLKSSPPITGEETFLDDLEAPGGAMEGENALRIDAPSVDEL